MRKVVFFDVDGTVFRSSLLIELVDGLIETGIFPGIAQNEFIEHHNRWLNREGTYEDYVIGVIDSFMVHIRGVFYGDFADVGRKVVNIQSKRVYRYTRDLIKKLKNDGYYMVAISQSPKTILDDFCATLGFDKVYGRIYEIGPQDRFTGELVDVHLIENKANIVRRVVEKENVTLKDSIAIGDTEGDITLLESVEQPICFNPNQGLYEYARQMDWKIVIERKDVIYEL